MSIGLSHALVVCYKVQSAHRKSMGFLMGLSVSLTSVKCSGKGHVIQIKSKFSDNINP